MSILSFARNLLVRKCPCGGKIVPFEDHIPHYERDERGNLKVPIREYREIIRGRRCGTCFRQVSEATGLSKTA